MSRKKTATKWTVGIMRGGKLAIYDRSDLSKPLLQGVEGQKTDQSVIRLAAAAPELLEALKDAVKNCGCCDGKGNAYTMADETEFGMSPGSSRVDCPICSNWRNAIQKATGEK